MSVDEMTPRPDVRSILNSSGFGFQLAVEREVRESDTGWSVLTTEHPWSRAGKSGFVDLVLECGIARLVVECKRARKANWVFLIREEGQEEVTRVRGSWADSLPGEPSPSIGWDDVHFAPATPESEFCSVRGTGERQEPMLERLASSCVEATHAIAISDGYITLLEPLPGAHDSGAHVFVPMIVTTARLWAVPRCYEAADLATGDIEPVEMKEVPAVRFRRSLARDEPFDMSATGLKDLKRSADRTVLVVGAAHIASFLGDLRMRRPPHGADFPWELARRRQHRAQDSES